MLEKEILYFDLEQICASGQCFRMKPLGENRFCVLAGDRYLEAVQDGSRLRLDCTEEEFQNYWKYYFDLDRDYGACIQAINPKDAYLTRAAEAGRGIRILRQELWETLVSFLISQQNNIVRIRRCIENICFRYGLLCSTDTGVIYHAFPTPEALSKTSEEELRDCNLGYRAKYVVKAAQRVVSGEASLEEIQQMDYLRAREALLEFYGVGEKVADCICLFSLHHLEAFPVDTHIRQALEAHYKRGFPKRRYKGIEGVIQQYIFYYELTEVQSVKNGPAKAVLGEGKGKLKA